jgi:hypothetical protein
MNRKNFRNFHNKAVTQTKKFGVKKDDSGQALIEFVLGLMIVISIFFFYVKMAATFAVGNFIHYATFMSARAYSASASTVDQQIQNAESVLRSLLVGRWKALIKPGADSQGNVPGATVGPGPYFQEDSLRDFWNQGVTYSFETKLAFYPWSKGNQSIKLDLVSESWMRREESITECNETKRKVQSSIRVPGTEVEWDNGC